jgi:hypothetical protein
VKRLNAMRIVAGAASAVLIGLFAQASAAQDSDRSRAEVKSQTKGANKSGDLWRGGEAPLPQQSFQPQKSRQDRKAETLNARQQGALLPSGQATFKAHTAQPPRSDRTRAERKAETLQAAKNGTLAPSGEAEDPAKAARKR